MKPFYTTFVVAALGYFVDIYDLILFGVVRVPSLISLGIPEKQLLDAGILLINSQMAGLMIGGVFWGILGDKKGRTTVMMASILMYSLANIANAFVFSLNAYVILRFIVGFGLAGEVGAAVTLVSESAPKAKRTLWTTSLTFFGLLGAIVASLVGDLLNWQTAYILGGSMGLLLLLIRLKVSESNLFVNSQRQNQGRIDLFVRSKKRFLRYIACVFVGVPIWFSVGMLMIFAPEFQQAAGSLYPATAGQAILYCYVGLTLGDLFCGYLSHLVQSRRGVIGLFLLLNSLLVVGYLNQPGLNQGSFLLLCSILGFTAGYWAVYITMVAESFGTNIRATAVIMVTNWMRGAVVLMTSSVQLFLSYLSLSQSCLLVGGSVILLAALSLVYLSETFGKELNYYES